MTEADLVKFVREDTGKITRNMGELDDSDIADKSTWILRKVGDWITIRTLRYITSTANEREYDVPSEVLRVTKVYPWGSVDEDIMILGSPKADESQANEYYNFPSLWAIKMMRKIRGLPRIRHEFDPINRKLRIDPYPEEAGKRYYYVSVDKSKWTLEDLPEDMEELVVIGTVWKSLEQVALKRSNLGMQTRSGGKVPYPSIEIKTYIDSKKDEFYELLRIKAMVYSR